MKGKVLLNVYTVQVKNDLLNIFVENQYDFLEVFNEIELTFKYNLIKDQLDLYIHELDELNYDASMNQIKKIDLEKVRCIVLIHEYSSRVIDDALALKVKDIVVLPMEKHNLAKKVLASTIMPVNKEMMPKTPPIKTPETVVQFDPQELENELSRAIRGGYPLSLVMVDCGDLIAKNDEIFREALAQLLRTTDQIVSFDENRLLLLCPFTPKANLVEVEHKVREAHKRLKELAIEAGRVFLYGVTFPIDGDSRSDLIEKMTIGLHDSILLSNLNLPLNKLNRNDVHNRLKGDYRQLR